MPIKGDDFEKFYQGTSAELHVASLFYFAGYEASKVAPDVGIDLIVTNLARAKFKSEEARRAEIQVKSALLDDTGAAYRLSSDELDFLCHSADRFTVFVLLHGLVGGVDPSSFDIYADLVDHLIDLDISRYEEGLMKIEGRQRLSKKLTSIFEFAESKTSLFWLNSAQMSRARAEGHWAKGTGKDKDSYFLRVNLADGAVKLGTTFLIPELTDVRYIMRDCKSAKQIMEGKFSYDHL